jgi:hypothetical protein
MVSFFALLCKNVLLCLISLHHKLLQTTSNACVYVQSNLIEWNTELLVSIIVNIVTVRGYVSPTSQETLSQANVVLSEMALDEVKEVTDFSTTARTGALTSVNMGDYPQCRWIFNQYVSTTTNVNKKQFCLLPMVGD